ncbi:MAG TPA: hypothetical protein VGO80_19795 [Solirubrobacteraceae bacterium]|jgi:hypothetical protein|nr:hypothetical protein [Solirubrobacteraceae bacterium]
MATAKSRIQVTVDDELASAMARIDPAPASRSRPTPRPGFDSATPTSSNAGRRRSKPGLGGRLLHVDAHYDTLASVMGFISARLDRD